MKKQKPDHISQADWDAVESPPLTKSFLSSMKPVVVVHPVYGKMTVKKKQCGACGAAAMLATEKDLANTYKGKKITVPAVRGWHCQECGECEFMEESEAERFASETSKAMAAIDAGLAKEIKAA